MQFRLRTLLIVLAVGPAAIASSYWFIRHVMGMEEWKFVVATIGLIAGYYFLLDAFTTEQKASPDEN